MTGTKPCAVCTLPMYQGGLSEYNWKRKKTHSYCREEYHRAVEYPRRKIKLKKGRKTLPPKQKKPVFRSAVLNTILMRTWA